LCNALARGAFNALASHPRSCSQGSLSTSLGFLAFLCGSGVSKTSQSWIFFSGRSLFRTMSVVVTACENTEELKVELHSFAISLASLSHTISVARMPCSHACSTTRRQFPTMIPHIPYPQFDRRARSLMAPRSATSSLSPTTCWPMGKGSTTARSRFSGPPLPVTVTTRSFHTVNGRADIDDHPVGIFFCIQFGRGEALSCRPFTPSEHEPAARASPCSPCACGRLSSTAFAQTLKSAAKVSPPSSSEASRIIISDIFYKECMN
jgi:hypothetical protein